MIKWRGTFTNTVCDLIQIWPRLRVQHQNLWHQSQPKYYFLDDLFRTGQRFFPFDEICLQTHELHSRNYRLDEEDLWNLDSLYLCCLLKTQFSQIWNSYLTSCYLYARKLVGAEKPICDTALKLNKLMISNFVDSAFFFLKHPKFNKKLMMKFIDALTDGFFSLVKYQKSFSVV